MAVTAREGHCPSLAIWLGRMATQPIPTVFAAPIKIVMLVPQQCFGVVVKHLRSLACGRVEAHGEDLRATRGVRQRGIS